jgi:exopolyphosphatase/guanosine-5'-triphosphate,3'-diphosphate pyrophosphatase
MTTDAIQSDGEKPQEPTPAETAAAIDIGATSVRMVIAQITEDGEIEVLEKFVRAMRMGQDTFQRGRLRAQAVRAGIGILRDYRRVLDQYDVKHVRAVATSSVREASNADTFLDRVFMATGLEVEVIDTSEESRLTVSAVREALQDVTGIRKRNALVADVGGGSTLLTVMEKGEIAASQSLRLGSIRLQEVLATSYEPPERSAELLRQQISNTISVTSSVLPLKKTQAFVAVGGDARFAARLAGKKTSSPHLMLVKTSALDALVKRIVPLNTEEIGREFSVPYSDAETIKPALLVYQGLARATGVKDILVSDVSMRDGVVLDLARRVTGEEDPALVEGVIHSATTIAEKYHVDMNHAENVSQLSVMLFDALDDEHRLGRRERLLLRVAGLLHEVGGYVSNRAHHKHSYYLTINSEIFGLSREEHAIVAHTTRYHRRSIPKPSHTEYMALARETRMVISKLAGILRVADALDRGHAQQVRDFTARKRSGELVLEVPGVSDLTLERRAMVNKGNLLEDIYGVKLRLEEASLTSQAARRTQPVE